MGAKRFRISTLAAVAALTVGVLSAGNPAQANAACSGANQQGCWSAPFSPFHRYDKAPPATAKESLDFPTAASAVVMPNGQIVYWNGLQSLEDCSDMPLAVAAGDCARNSRSMILDLTGTGTEAAFYDVVTNDGDDLFCADQRVLANGEVFVAGGTRWENQFVAPDGTPLLAELYGSKQSHIFDGTAWRQGAQMAHGRWYPSMVTLADGRLFIAGGVTKLLWNSDSLDPRADEPYPQNVRETEIYDPATGTWTENPGQGNVALPLYARLHLLPNGQVFYGGAGQMWGPAGESVDQFEWNFEKLFSLTTKAWTDLGTAAFGARSGAFSAMLPLRPDANGDYTEAKVLIGGGVLGTSPGGWIATNLAEIVTAKAGASGAWTVSTARAADLVNRRWFSSAVVLPNGNMLAFNGGDKDEVVQPGIEAPVRQAELWDGSKWVGLSSGGRDRVYHNSALLLPDGSVLVGGHAPINWGYGGRGLENNQANGWAHNFKDPAFERFFPPYLYAGDRPVIQTAQSHATWGGTLTATLEPGSEPVAKVVLSRIPAVTHTTDADNRTIELAGAAQDGASITASIPANRAVVPPGYYYVFGLSAAGVPSVATIVQVAEPTQYDARPGSVTPVSLVDTPLR